MGCRSELGKDLAIKEECRVRSEWAAKGKSFSQSTVLWCRGSGSLPSLSQVIVCIILDKLLIDSPDWLCGQTKGAVTRTVDISALIIEKQVARFLSNAQPKRIASSWRPWAADILTIQNSDPTSVRPRARFLWCHFRPKCNDFLWICPPNPKKIISRRIRSTVIRTFKPMQTEPLETLKPNQLRTCC